MLLKPSQSRPVAQDCAGVGAALGRGMGTGMRCKAGRGAGMQGCVLEWISESEKEGTLKTTSFQPPSKGGDTGA